MQTDAFDEQYRNSSLARLETKKLKSSTMKSLVISCKHFKVCVGYANVWHLDANMQLRFPDRFARMAPGWTLGRLDGAHTAKAELTFTARTLRRIRQFARNGFTPIPTECGLHMA